MFRFVRLVARFFVCIACTLALAISIVGAGFAVCAFVPQTTDILAHLTQDDSNSTYDAAALNDLANAARDYTVADNNRDALIERFINIASKYGSAYSGMDSDTIKAAMENAVNSTLAQRYIFDNTALDHLDDVYSVVTIVKGVLIFCAIAAATLLLLSGIFFGRKCLAREFICAGGAVILIFLVLGAWAALDFNQMFNWLHTLFFTGESWIFPADSLLITIYPQNFWIGMGIIWLVISLACAIIALIVGLKLSKRK
jgi:integral membrane protein (TIGR01906 family)